MSDRLDLFLHPLESSPDSRHLHHSWNSHGWTHSRRQSFVTSSDVGFEDVSPFFVTHVGDRVPVGRVSY